MKLKNKGRHINIPIFIPHLGCPNICVFCDQRNISGRETPIGARDIGKVIEEWIKTASPNDDVELAFFGGSFTGIPREEMTAYLEAAHGYVRSGAVSGIRISTRPDYIDNGILDILERYGVKVIELGVQSMNDDILLRSKRGHTVKDVEEAARLIKKRGFVLGIQIMPGLPGDTPETSLETALKVISLEPGLVRVYPAVVLKNTELETYFWQGLYKPLSVDEAVSICAGIVPLFRSAGISVVRIGLHYSEALEDSVVAGPFHPALGEMVESRILLDRIIRIIEEKGLENSGKILILTWKGAVSRTLGHKHANTEALKKRYGYAQVIIREGDCPAGSIDVAAYAGGDSP